MLPDFLRTTTDTGDLELLVASGNVFGASLCVKIDTVSLNITFLSGLQIIYKCQQVSTNRRKIFQHKSLIDL